MDTQAVKELEEEISESQHQVIMFALEWCDFCWATVKVLEEYGIPYRVINLDSADYVDNNRGRNIRLALNEQTSWTTLPQIYINGKFIGGCMDIFNDCVDGSLQTRLDGSNISYNKDIKTDPTTFLPTWLHPR